MPVAICQTANAARYFLINEPRGQMRWAFLSAAGAEKRQRHAGTSAAATIAAVSRSTRCFPCSQSGRRPPIQLPATPTETIDAANTLYAPGRRLSETQAAIAGAKITAH